MRIYVPATASDLLADGPRATVAYAITEGLAGAFTGLDSEDLEEAAADFAADESLRLLRVRGDRPRRLVAAFDIEAERTGPAPTRPADPAEALACLGLTGPVTWAECQAIMVDDGEVLPVLRRALTGDTEAEAQCYDYPLAWYDASELGDLAKQSSSWA